MKPSVVFIIAIMAGLLAECPARILCQEQPISPYATLATSGNKTVLETRSRRCLSGAICTLAGRYAIPVSFEDAPIRYRDEYDDITSPAYHPKSATDHLLVPHGGPLLLSFPTPSEQPNSSEVESLLKLIISASIKSGFPGTYDVRRLGVVWHIVPAAAKDEKGILRPVEAIMDTKLVLPYKIGHSNREVLFEMFSQIKRATGKEMFLGSPLSNIYLDAQYTGTAEGSAREVLEDSFREFGGHQLWILQCSPVFGPCALSIF